ncbi:hypothetical protein D3C86_785050 [compost metagenome]
MVFGGMQIGVRTPAVLGNVGDQVAAVQQRRPKTVRGSAGEAERESDYGNALSHAMSFSCGGLRQFGAAVLCIKKMQKALGTIRFRLNDIKEFRVRY